MAISTLLSVCSQGCAVFEQDRRELACCAQGTSETLAGQSKTLLCPFGVVGDTRYEVDIGAQWRCVLEPGGLLCVEQIGASRHVCQESELSSELCVVGDKLGRET